MASLLYYILQETPTPLVKTGPPTIRPRRVKTGIIVFTFVEILLGILLKDARARFPEGDTFICFISIIELAGSGNLLQIQEPFCNYY